MADGRVMPKPNGILGTMRMVIAEQGHRGLFKVRLYLVCATARVTLPPDFDMLRSRFERKHRFCGIYHGLIFPLKL
jgi:hypothetical protein